MDMTEVAKIATEARSSVQEARRRIDKLENEVNDIHNLVNAMIAVKEKVDGLESDVCHRYHDCDISTDSEMRRKA